MFVRLLVPFVSEKANVAIARFCEAEEMCPVLAALQYVTSSVAVMEVVSLNSSTRTRGCGKSSDEAVEEVDSPFNVNRSNAASYIENTLNICMSIMRLHTSELLLVKCLHHPLCGFVDDREFFLSKLSSAVKNWQKQASTMLSKNLLFEMALPENLREMLHGIKDSLTHTNFGWCFTKHRQNTGWRTSLAQCVVKHL